MIYALLAAASSVTPTAIPIPTPTATPVIEAISAWDKADVIGSFALGFAALVISIIALMITLSQQRKEENMWQHEAKIAVLDKAFEIYKFFKFDICNDRFYDTDKPNWLKKSFLRMSEIDFLANILFRKSSYTIIHMEIEKYKNILLYNKYLDYETLSNQFRNLGLDKLYEKVYKENEKDTDESRKRILTVQLSLILIDRVFEKYRLDL